MTHRRTSPAPASRALRALAGPLLALALLGAPAAAALPGQAAPAAAPGQAAPAARTAVATDDTPAPDPEKTVQWGVRPGDTAQGVDRPNFAYSLAPGGSLRDSLVVSNHGDTPLALAVYAADGFLTDDGTLDLLPAGEESTALGSWIALDQAEVEIPPQERVEVPFTVTVPDDATPGDYAAGVVSSLVVVAEDGVTTDRRLGSRVHLRVQGELAPALAVDEVRLAYDGTLNPFAPGSATVTFTVTNEGNARVAPATAVRVSGPFGLGATSATDVDVPELLPGSSVERTVEVDGVWPLGREVATLTVGGEVVPLPGTVPDPEVVVPGVVATTATWAVPWVALGLLVLVALLVVWRVRARRRARTAQQRAVDAAVTAALAERAAGGADEPTTEESPNEPVGSPAPDRDPWARPAP
ncbi:WxL protein peptidoglycan domain-containing protein [Cellulosimicrobium funkei]|uniref:WxL protein peptidoglycan domain-containing protein n=1 Tax=Cellulosimicrobium funkei TaxID=264251 RepID=UPI0030FAE6B5